MKSCSAAAAAQALPDVALLEWLKEAAAEAQSSKLKATTHNLLRQANPLVGTGWRGHMFPGALAPFGLVQLSPDTSGLSEPKWNIQGDWYEWQHCSGYNYNDKVINGFSHTHIQGAGGIDLGDVLVMPIVEGRNWYWETGKIEPLSEMQIRALGEQSGIVFCPSELGYRSFFSHEREIARPAYYSVHLETPDVHVELTATTRCGMHRYSYQAHDRRQGIVVDLAHGLNCRVYAAELTVESTRRISGKRSTHGWALDRDVYFVLELSEPASTIEVNVDGAISPAQVGSHFSGKELKVIVTRGSDTVPLLIRLGISPVSVEGAKKNLHTEISGWDFDAVVRQTEQAWAEALSVLEATFPSKALEETFYSDFYHSLVAPATYCDTDGSLRGQDRKNHANPGFTKYTILSIWAIYRGEFPFLSLAQPQRVSDIVNTLLLDYQQLELHSLPMWPLWSNETWSMTGFHAAGMILGAYVRGFRDFDVEAAYVAIRAQLWLDRLRKTTARFRQYSANTATSPPISMLVVCPSHLILPTTIGARA